MEFLDTSGLRSGDFSGEPESPDAEVLGPDHSTGSFEVVSLGDVGVSASSGAIT